MYNLNRWKKQKQIVHQGELTTTKDEMLTVVYYENDKSFPSKATTSKSTDEDSLLKEVAHTIVGVDKKEGDNSAPDVSKYVFLVCTEKFGRSLYWINWIHVHTFK